MKKIMILGASILQTPAILKAKEMGLQVIAVDMDKNAIGFKDADVSLEISTLDIPKVMEVAKQYHIDGIITLASDMPIRTVAKVAKKMGLIGISEDVAFNSTDKYRMIKCFEQFNIPIPWFHRIRTFDEFKQTIKNLVPPYIIKPTDNSGSRGVALVTESSDPFDAYNYSKASARAGDVLIEEYMQGHEVSVECFAYEKEIHVLQITDKITTGPPHFVEMGHSQPSLLPTEMQEKIKNVAKSACKAIGISYGPAHVEIIVTKSGPKMIELGARMGGDCITSHLVPLSTGIDMVGATIAQACGEKFDLAPKHIKGSAIRYIKANKGRIKSITGIDKAMAILGVKEVIITKSLGESLYGINSSTDRVGYIISQAENSDKAIDICNKALEEITIEVD